MLQHLSAQTISQILFKLDPMGTCCVENDMYDEYDYIADTLEGLFKDNPGCPRIDIAEMVDQAFTDEFGGIDRSVVVQIVEALFDNK